MVDYLLNLTEQRYFIVVVFLKPKFFVLFLIRFIWYTEKRMNMMQEKIAVLRQKLLQLQDYL